MGSKEYSLQNHLNSLRKILDLEKQHDFKNTAVIGGLDKFLESIKYQVGPHSGSLDIFLPSGGYADLTKTQRRAWTRRCLVSLDGWSERDRMKGEARLGGKPSETASRSNAIPPHHMSSLDADLDLPLRYLSGVNVKLSGKLHSLGINTIRDLLYFFPRRHNDFSTVSKVSQLIPGEEYTVIVNVWESNETTLGSSRIRATQAILGDETGNIRAIWFGRRYMSKTIKPGVQLALSGRVGLFKGYIQFESPEFEILNTGKGLIHTGRLVPVYPLTEGLTPKRIRNITWQAVSQWGTKIQDFLPSSIKKRNGLMGLTDSILQMHYPDNTRLLEQARRRLAFDEFFLLQMAVLTQRKAGYDDSGLGFAISPDINILDAFFKKLPFVLTQSQKRCIDEILHDMERANAPMNRLLQGEVGSGKTVVALAALISTVISGYQGSIMVPTEVLAEQHFATISKLLGTPESADEKGNIITFGLDGYQKNISVGLLTGGTPSSTKKAILRKLSSCELDLVVGTHALIQDSVEIPRLALAVVDEQHRFGVLQRDALSSNVETRPHVLVMSATPIPRTLALTIYCDLDISTIDHLPDGRQQVMTRLVPSDRREGAYNFLRKEIRSGRQAFIICPLIEESEAVEAKAAVIEYNRLSSETYPDLSLGLLHGKMTGRQKDIVMRKFRDGQIDVLISTAVVEVGIDVPNATVMLVEGAHRFGLSQLHQFRGRVGRGEYKSFCLLLAENLTPVAQERLTAIEKIHDGFHLSEVDLNLRGPGDIFGTRQSGLPDLRVARFSDQDILKMARDEVVKLVDEDYNPDGVHGLLGQAINRYIGRMGSSVIGQA